MYCWGRAQGPSSPHSSLLSPHKGFKPAGKSGTLVRSSIPGFYLPLLTTDGSQRLHRMRDYASVLADRIPFAKPLPQTSAFWQRQEQQMGSQVHPAGRDASQVQGEIHSTETAWAATQKSSFKTGSQGGGTALRSFSC